MDYWKFLRSKLGQSQIIIPGADGIIRKEDRILLVKNAKTKQWYVPGGLQELNESIEETVVREVWEEISLKTTVKQLISIYTSKKWIKKYPNGDMVQSFTCCFLLDYNPQDIEGIKIDNKEIEEYNWFNIEELPHSINECSKKMCLDFRNYSGITLLN